MTAIVVDAGAGLLHVEHKSLPCTIGRSGICEAGDKREGDGRTPLGIWPIRTVLLRPDAGLVPPALPWRWIRRDDGWSDDPRDPAYNRPVRHPHGFSAEHMWRDDDRYDALFVLGHNDRPPVPGLGSAIFLHLRGPLPTEGCVAIERDAMAHLLRRLDATSVVDIRRNLGDSPPLG